MLAFVLKHVGALESFPIDIKLTFEVTLQGHGSLH